MLERRHDDAEPRAGLDVDVRIDAALADQAEIRQAFEQRRADLRALAEQHQRLGGLQPGGEAIDVLLMVVPHRHLVAAELREAGQGAQRVEIVVEDGDFHALCSRKARPRAVISTCRPLRAA